MSVTGYWDDAFAAAMSVKSDILTRTLQWVFGDAIQIDADYEIEYRKLEVADTLKEVDFIADKAITVNAYAGTGRVHVEVQAQPVQNLAKRMLEYGSALSVPWDSGKELVFPAQAVVLLEAERKQFSRKFLECRLSVAGATIPFGKYGIPVKYLAEDSEGTIFWPAFKSEISRLKFPDDVGDWQSTLGVTSMQLPESVRDRYVSSLKRAAARRYHVKEEMFMSNEELYERYKDIPDPFKIARNEGKEEGREEGREEGIEDVIKMMRRSGMTEEQIANVLSGRPWNSHKSGGVKGMKLD